MARIDDDEIRAMACLDRLKLLLDRYGRRVGTPYFVARGKDEGGHHLRVTLLPVASHRGAVPPPPAPAKRGRDDLTDLISEFQTLSEVVGAQHQQILDLIDVLAGMDAKDTKPAASNDDLSAVLEEYRASARRQHLRVVRTEQEEASD
ncbi:hypothetical protein [uncultured Alsobacter sp.]|uniref:hypothetical protein n=1 Tax=uncultured Alsobacter sp. TaxID=1748258 RepID=UPI0025E655B4|nr:hypothetical protein [uncultured Alsobacter sp.]